MVAAYPHWWITPVLQHTTQPPYHTYEQNMFCLYVTIRKIFRDFNDVRWCMAWNVTDALVDIQIRNKCCKISSTLKTAWSQLWATLCDHCGLNCVTICEVTSMPYTRTCVILTSYEDYLFVNTEKNSYFWNWGPQVWRQWMYFTSFFQKYTQFHTGIVLKFKNCSWAM
jgi:hypothetical protein